MKTHPVRSAVVAALLAAAALSGSSQAETPSQSIFGAGPAIPVTVNEGTAFSFALSPDHKSIVMDLQGTLFVLPVTGGHARAITDDLYDAREPSWSADGRSIAFQSSRSGHWQIWTVGADGSQPHELTTGIHEGREPSWSPDGSHIAFVSDRSGEFQIWNLDLKSGRLTQLSHDPGGPGGNLRPSWSPDGTQVAYASFNPGGPGIYAVDLSGKSHKLYGAQVFGFGMSVPLGTPSWSPDGSKVLYAVIAGGKATLMMNGEPQVTGEDVFPARPQWLDNDTFLYAANGKIKRRSLSTGAEQNIEFQATFTVRKPQYTKKHHDFDSTAPRALTGIQRSAISPDGKQIAFAALGNLWVMPVGGEARRLTDNGPYEVVDPAWSPDGRQIVYANDRRGSFDIWTYDLASGRQRRLTSAPGAEMRPAWSPDGSQIAYENVFGSYTEQVEILDLATGKSRTLATAGDSPGYPQWSPDGKLLMVSRLASFSSSESYYSGGENQISIVPVAGGKARDVTLDQGYSVGDRTGDGPAWSPDGKWVAFRRGAALWVAPFKPDGAPAGAARKISDDVVTCLTWAGDSRTLLAQSAGRLTLYHPETGASQPVPMSLTYRRAVPEGTMTIHAGRLVDGVHPTAQTDVDIVVTRNRIVSVTPHGSHPVQGRLVDASGLTVMPGLMDMHEHLIKEYGSNFGRLLLAYGVTTVRSPGNVPGDVLEEKQSIDAGMRPGPRLFAAGYIIDGEHTVWEMGTSVRSKPEVDRIMAFDHAADLDMVKTYVHTSEPIRQYAIEQAHRIGLIETSHELFPSAEWGADSVEHLDGNGCSRGYCTKASQLNIAYDDVAQIISHAGMTVTPTVSLFTPPAQFPQGVPDSRHDPRDALQPSWVRGKPPQTMGGGPGGDVLINNIRQSILSIYKAGGRVVVGTDSPFSPVGINTQNELEQEVRAGLTPFQALQTATTVPAELLGVAHDLGTVEAGKLADLVFVDGNPLVDIHDAMKIQKVMTNGVLYNLNDLIKQGTGADEESK